MYIFFDLDSTLSKIEGMDEIAKWKGIEDEISEITRKTMAGELDFTESFPSKVATLNASKQELEKLGQRYIETKVDNLHNVLGKLRDLGYQIGIITGNFNPAVDIFAAHLGISKELVFCNELEFDSAGNFKSFNPKQILADSDGKKNQLKLLLDEKIIKGQIIYVGDSTSDMKTREVADKFIGFGGVEVREKVKEEAEFFVYDMAEILMYNLLL